MIKSILTVVLGLISFSYVSAQSTTITFIVKDQNTGFAVPGAVVQVTAPNGSTNILTAAANGKLVYAAVNGRYNFSIASNGYKPLATYFSSGTETTIEARINLEPVDNNVRLQQQSLRANVQQTVVNGYVRDDTGNNPLAGVQVSSGNATTTTDGNGYFSLVVGNTAPVLLPGSTPEKTTISFTKNGYTSYTVQNFYVIPDSYTMKIALTTVSGARLQTAAPAVEQSLHGMFDRTAADEQQRSAVSSAPTARVETTLAATVPTSIRVGTSCSCTSCSSVEVMSLEAYAGTGLDDEWIASWGAASLRAGAVAYRTYGAWYVLHPVASSFDIASTTCNQVWQSDQSTSCINAASATAGIVLVKSGAIFRAEYAAENNNAGCGDGYSGTGSAWPCISDTRCAGYAKNGHGRGMCQWGSSRWASDKDYTWILNHYYNPGSVFIQLPPTPALTVASFSVKDQSTGLAIASAAVTITKPDGTTSSTTTNASGQLVYRLDSGKYTFAFSKSGYKNLSTFFTGGPDDSVYADINLDVASTARVATNTAPLLTANSNQMVLTGYVRDASLNSALSGVQVQAGNYTATTNASGFFSLTIPTNAISPGQTPATISIQSTKAGYITHHIQHFYAIPDSYDMQIALTATNIKRTALTDELVIRRHGLFDKTTAEQIAFADNNENTARQASTVSTAALAVPTVIRVATSCACTACT
ncbi:carboxypeptidase regulatory-like domain-containing protein, partial [Niastella koreensis]